ncbi:unnamed protein product, partial [marine sediment metagenome]
CEQLVWILVSDTPSTVIVIDVPSFTPGVPKLNGSVFSTSRGPNTTPSFAVTWDGSSFHIYVNGVDQSYDDLSKPTFTSVWDNDQPVYIGVINTQTTQGLGYFFEGLIDEVEIFNCALSALEIQAIYNAG